MSAEEKRVFPFQLREDHIGQALADSEATGELRSAPSFGKPLNFGDGYDETPDELKMPMKILKDAGFVPPEVEAMQRLAALREDAANAATPAEAQRLQREASELQQAIELRLERLRSGTL